MSELDYSSDLFLRTCGGESTPIKPVWIMRQAGRYLEEYRKVRASFPSFVDFYMNPEACCEVTMQPLRRFKLDAAILFSDILTLLPPLGVGLEFVSGRGPVIARPVRSAADVDALPELDVEADLSFVYAAVRKIVKTLDGRIPLLGFAGGPLTVASYMIEGGSSKELAETKRLAAVDPIAFGKLMEKISRITIQYLRLQVEAGAQALVVMDSWAGYFGPQDYRELILPWTRMVFEGIQDLGVPTLHYANGASHLLKDFAALPCQGLGLDWRIEMPQAIEIAGHKVLQGNLDPTALFGPTETVRRRTRELVQQIQNRPHIMNLGHGVLPQTPVSGVQAFVETLRQQG